MALFRGSALRAALNLRLLPASLNFSSTSLPLIDVGPLTNSAASVEEKQAVGRQLHDACLNVGFFYAQGHGVPAELTDSVMVEARKWFALPEEEKQRIALSPTSHYRGWQRLGSNVTQGKRDLHEGIDLYREVDAAELAAAGLPASPIHGRNPWPQTPAFQAALRAYVDECLGLGAAILRGIALGLQLPETFFEGDMAGDSYWVSRILYYPSLPGQPASSSSTTTSSSSGTSSSTSSVLGGAQQRQQQQQQQQQQHASGSKAGSLEELSCGEHTDYGLLTLVFAEPGVTALQVKSAEGQWLDAPPVPGAVVINIGDMFSVFTNGLYTPTAHRHAVQGLPACLPACPPGPYQVVNRSGRDRVSIPFFYETNFEAVIQPQPQFCVQRPAQFEAVRYGSHLESKVRGWSSAQLRSRCPCSHVLHNFDFESK
ncbi:putative 2-oxoglutarate-dependent dioxygenase [Chlorella vulgaris]